MILDWSSPVKEGVLLGPPVSTTPYNIFNIVYSIFNTVKSILYTALSGNAVSSYYLVTR